MPEVGSVRASEMEDMPLEGLIWIQETLRQMDYEAQQMRSRG